MDATESTLYREKLLALHREALNCSRELLDHQLRMAQDITRLLAEQTARGEELVKNLEERNIVVSLYEELLRADQITFLVGRAENPAATSQPFFQMGILRRQQIVPLLAEKLKALGKLVTVEWV